MASKIPSSSASATAQVSVSVAAVRIHSSHSTVVLCILGLPWVVQHYKNICFYFQFQSQSVV